MESLERARDGYVDPLETSAQANKRTAASRSWISFDQEGRGTVLDLDKYAIIHRMHISARDFRLLDPLLCYPSKIVGKKKVIVLNLEHIKAIITAEEVLLGDPFDYNVQPVVDEFQRRLPLTSANFNGQGDEEECGVPQDADADEEDDIPFEFRALEVALEAICSFLRGSTIDLEAAVYPALDALTSKVSSRNIDRVHKLKNAVTSLTNRVQKVNDELERLLKNDANMANLYLARKLVGTSSPVSDSGAPNQSFASPTITIGSNISKRSRTSVITAGKETDVQEVEMLLETYLMQIDGTLHKLTTSREYIDGTVDYINLQLDKRRNKLIQIELFQNSGSVCVSVYSLVTAIFGMNIPYSWNENHGHMFKWVVIITGILGALIFLLIISYARHKGLLASQG